MPSGDVYLLCDGLECLLYLRGQHPAVGVAEADGVCARLGAGPEALEGVVAIAAEAVEEVLRIQAHLDPVLLHEGDRVADHLEVLLRLHAERGGDVQIPGLRHDGGRRSAQIHQVADARVFVGLCAGAAGHPEDDQLGAVQGLLPHAGEELHVGADARV